MLDALITDLEIVLRLRGLAAFLQDILKIEKTLADLADSLAKLNLSLLDFGKGALGIGMITIAFMGLKRAIEDAANLEPFKVSLKNFFSNSMEQAKATLAELREFTLNSPFAFDQNKRSMQTLLAMGFKRGELPEAMNVVNSLAALSGDMNNSYRIALAIGQMNAKANLSMEELSRQLTNAGVPATQLLGQALAKKLHISLDEAMNRIQSGTTGLSGKQAVRMLFDQVLSDDRFKNVLGDQANTALGQWQKLQNMLLFISQDIGENLLPILAGLLQAINFVVYWFYRLNEATGGKAGLTVLLMLLVGGMKLVWGVGVKVHAIFNNLHTVLQQLAISANNAANANRKLSVSQSAMMGAYPGLGGVVSVDNTPAATGWKARIANFFKGNKLGIGMLLADIAGGIALNQWQPEENSTGSMIKAALGGALVGGSIGSLFGPWGAAIGGIAGLIIGAIQSGMERMTSSDDKMNRMADNSDKTVRLLENITQNIASGAMIGTRSSQDVALDAYFNNNLRRGVY